MFPVAQEGTFRTCPQTAGSTMPPMRASLARSICFDRHGVNASSFMTGTSFERYPHSWTGQAGLFTPRLDVTDRVQ